MNNFRASNEALLYINDIMKEQDKIDGLNKRHVAQIIRRNMSQRVKDSKKIYDRKKEKRNLAF